MRVSPPIADVLPGVSLAFVRELAAQLAIPMTERRLTPDELKAAEEVMLASTSVCLLPVVSCDDQPIGTGQPGAAFERLLNAWGEAVGVDIAEQARQMATKHPS